MTVGFQRAGAPATALPSGGTGAVLSPTRPHPHDLRLAARTRAYPNSETEREYVAATDKAVFDRVRTYERALVEVAEEFMNDSAVDLQASEDVISALKIDVRFPLEEGADPRDLAERYEELRRHADTALRALQHIEANALWHADRAEDPYTSFSALLSKYPGVMPTITL